jgi:2-dehydro-3-deoxyphosphogluconate aldolase/(4S)-4-hydroxy-2-oxoglutarate aldolase
MFSGNFELIFVKISPATSVDPRYFKDIKGPLPHIKLVPTGGVNLENTKDFIRNGARCVGIGSALLDEKAIEDKNWQILTQRATDFVSSINMGE